MSFTYNDEGIRTSKTVNGVTHTYQLNGSQIVAEYWEDKLLVYLYDASGLPIGMMYRTTSYELNEWATFFFEKNLQGDIVALYNSSGLKLVTYEYDAWGNQTVTYHAGSSSGPAQYNPFRYRGYYYDADLGMYYLQSRYYDPNTCRFINADGYVSTGQGVLGYNMFAYCGNNPVMSVDPSGESSSFALFIVSTVAYSIIAFISSSILDGLSYEDSCGDALIIKPLGDDAELDVLFYDIEVNDISIGNVSAATDITATIGGLSLTKESNGVTSDFSMLTAEVSLAMLGAGAGVYLSSIGESKNVSLFGKEISIGWEINTGVGFECKVGPKTELGLSLGIGGSLAIDWDP